MTLSGSDLCMLEHVDELAAAKLNAFYVQSHGEDASYSLPWAASIAKH